jgi:hypothetical protein
MSQLQYFRSASSAAEAVPSAPDALGYFRAAGYELLAVTADHAAAVAALLSLHRDSFDRIIIAQVLHEPLRLMTNDPMVKSYSETFFFGLTQTGDGVLKLRKTGALRLCAADVHGADRPLR